MDTIPNMAGCDSLISINLTVNSSSSSTVTTSSCLSYTAPSGTTYTVSGTYLDVIPNTIGCDSLITINLTIDTINLNVTQSGNTLTAMAAGAVYQWIDCSNSNSPLSGETAQSFTATANGSYAVIITQNTCMDTSACYSINTTGIGNAFSNRVKLYPQPTNGSFTVDLGLVYKSVFLSVMDSKGSIVYSQNAADARLLTVDMNVPHGLYTVQVIAGTERAALRVIKE
jgi:hypothetical protein